MRRRSCPARHLAWGAASLRQGARQQAPCRSGAIPRAGRNAPALPRFRPSLNLHDARAGFGAPDAHHQGLLDRACIRRNPDCDFRHAWLSRRDRPGRPFPIRVILLLRASRRRFGVPKPKRLWGGDTDLPIPIPAHRGHPGVHEPVQIRPVQLPAAFWRCGPLPA